MPKVETTDAKGLVQSSGTGVVMNSAFALGYQTVTASGTTQGLAAAVSASGGSIVSIGGADNTAAVRLPALADVEVGHMFVLLNTVTNAALEVFPATDDKVLPGGDNAAITVAQSSGLVVFKADATQWIGFEPAAIAV